MASAFVKYDSFSVNLCKAAFDLQTAGSQLMLVYSNTAADVVPGTPENRAALTEVSYTNITETPPNDITNVGSEAPPGVWNIAGTDVTLNATGAVATFRYVIMYDELSTTDLLVGSWDYGVGGVTLADGESFTTDFDPTSVFTVGA